MTLSRDQIDRAKAWLSDLPTHILREKIERGHSFGSGKTFSDKGKIMEVLQQTAAIAEMLFDREQERAALSRQSLNREASHEG